MLLMSGSVFAADRGQCQQKAKEAIKSLDEWIGKYNQQLEAAEPVQKSKYQEWIRELKKLKTLVTNAQDKLSDPSGCSDDECVGDNCQVVDIADQQITQLIKETEEQLGSNTRFGEEAGRDINVDTTTTGDDTIVDRGNPNDAAPVSTADQSDGSDTQTGGRIGDVAPPNTPDDTTGEEQPPNDPSTYLTAQ